MRYPTFSLTCWLALHTLLRASAAEMPSSALLLFRVVDLNRGEAAQITLRPGDAATFKMRMFRTAAGAEMWDFGDGSPRVEVQSDGNAKPLGKEGYAVTQHRYTKAGKYIARVERSNERGETAVARLVIEVAAR